MSDCIGANDASTSALDAETLKQERISAAYESATEWLLWLVWRLC